MGVIMDTSRTTRGLLLYTLLFAGSPVMFWLCSGVPRRSLLQEEISLMTLIGFGLIVGQFFLTRGNRFLFRKIGFQRGIALHRMLGFITLPALLAHPLLLVLPRYFTTTTDPRDAFMTIVTTVHNAGIVTGICAWSALLLLGITSLSPWQKLLGYRVWRGVHRLLAALFLVTGSWHVIDLGRHMSPVFAVWIIAGTVGALSLYIKPLAPGWKTNHSREATTC